MADQHFMRSTDGLRDALMMEMEDWVRNNKIVIESMQVDISKEEFEYQKARHIEQMRLRKEELELDRLMLKKDSLLLEHRSSEYNNDDEHVQ